MRTVGAPVLRGSPGADRVLVPGAGDGGRPGRAATALALAALLVVAALLWTWNIGYVGLSPYYAAAARSMAESPRALAFGALDPGASVTLDKLSGFLLPQALSIALFGVHPWALALPQVLEGLVTVAAGYVIGLRWRGRGHGLGIAGLLVTTPMLAAMSARPTEDALAAMCQVLAFVALQHSILTDRSRWLIVSGLWVAVGFQAKMMESWLLLPALVVASLVGSRAPLRIRVLHIAIGVRHLRARLPRMDDGDPARPGRRQAVHRRHHGRRRLLDGVRLQRIRPADPRSRPRCGPAAERIRRCRACAGQHHAHRRRRLERRQAPDAAVHHPDRVAPPVRRPGDGLQREWRGAAAAGPPRPVVEAGVGPDTRRTRDATEIGLAVWLACTVVVLSAAFVPHVTYFAPIALPIAAFAVHGAAEAVSAYRSGRSRAVLLALVGAQTVWAASILVLVPRQLHPMLAAVVVAGSLSVAALGLARRRRSTGIRMLGLGLGLVVGLVGPATWSLFTIGSGGGGSASDAFAGPPIGADGSIPLIATGRRTGLIVIHRPFSAPGGIVRLSPADAALLRYVDARNRAGSIPFASDSLPVVQEVILGSDAGPMPMGGYSGRAPEPTAAALEHLVRTGRLRFVLLQQAARTDDPVLATARSWIRRRCTVALSGRFRARSSQRLDLFDCATPADGSQVPR